jgi:hypothetical protein
LPTSGTLLLPIAPRSAANTNTIAASSYTEVNTRVLVYFQNDNMDAQ